MALCNSIVSTIPWIGAFITVISPLLLYAIHLTIFNRREFYPYLPYISDMGLLPPGASMLSMFLCFSSILFVLFLLFRYKITRELLKDSEDPHHQTFPFYSLIAFTIFTIGCAMVGSFRNCGSHFTQTIHNLAATMTFSFYLLDVYLEMKIAQMISNQKIIAKIRKYILFFGTFFALLMGPLCAFSFVLYPEAFFDESLRLSWKPGDPGWFLHLISAICEWMVALSVAPFLLTYVTMFNKKKGSQRKSAGSESRGSHSSSNSSGTEMTRL